MESLRILVNKLEVAQFFNTDMNREYQRAFAVGETVYVKLPQRFVIREGTTYDPQAIDRKTVPVTMDQIFGVDFDYDSVDKALNMERGEDIVRREYIEPAMAQIKQEIDSRCAQYAYYNTPNIVGALGTTPTALSTYLSARQRLVELGCTPGEKGMIVSPAMHSTIAGQLTTLTNPANEISRQYKEGLMGNASGFQWYESVSLYSHTCGTLQNTCTVQTTLTDGATSVSIAGTAAETLKKGDVFTFSASYACNPGTRRSVGHLKNFVVTQDLTLTGGTDTLYFAPAIYGPDSPYQNVDALPVGSSATITNMPGTTAPYTGPKYGINGLAINRDAFALVGVKLEEPKAVEVASTQRDPKSGLAISFVRQFEGRTRTMINRFDVLLGFGSLYAENCACRVASLL